MTKHNVLNPRDDVDRLCKTRKEGGRGVNSIEESVDASTQQLTDYIRKTKNTNYSDLKQHNQHNKKTKNEKKNNYMDISSDKQAKSHTG